METLETREYPIKIEQTQQSRIKEVDFTKIPFGKVFSDHMFYADYVEGKWTNATIKPYGNISFAPSISGLHYGQLIFEGMKAYKNEAGETLLFRPLMNYDRMVRSAKRMAMPAVPKEIFREGLLELLRLDNDWIPPHPGSSLYIRPFMFATDEYVGIRPSENYRFMIFTCPVGPYYDRPVKVKVAEKYVRAFEGGTGQAKTAGNYAATLMPVIEAKQQGFDQILWLDGCHFDEVHEIGTMNVFFVIDGTVVTPSTEKGTILEGVTRDSVIQIFESKGVPVEVRPLKIAEVVDAHEKGLLHDAFGAGTAATIAHISEIGYKDKHMILPDVKDRPISNMVKEELINIKKGRVADTFDWIYKVPA